MKKLFLALTLVLGTAGSGNSTQQDVAQPATPQKGKYPYSKRTVVIVLIIAVVAFAIGTFGKSLFNW